MNVPYHLRYLPTSAPATALLVPGHCAADILRVCVELALDPIPPIYAVADGFIVHLPTPTERPIAGALRLRGLSMHLLLPINAELIPPLLTDEAIALVRKRGLVFLPGSRVLEYDPAQPIALASLVQIEEPRRRPWQALPEPPTLAEDITEITLFDVGTSAEQVLEPGGEGIGTQDPTLETGNLPARTLGNVLFSLGQGIAKLGQSLGSKALAGLGARLLDRAMSFVPALSQKLMGEQEAKLRELLRQFREGNIDQALQHALPLGGDPARGMVPAPNAQLPTHSLFYSLVNLMGTGAGGPASMWFTPDHTYYALLREYRKQAELATGRGDFRRAAFIYAKLLNDYHSAARVLAQGGLHRDAAVLFEKKLHDLTSAALEWEAAGEFDRAIELYRRMGAHERAGDLLRRIGEEERAVKEYQIAAAKMVEFGAQHFAAGEMLRGRAERPDLALPYYEAGWKNRPEGEDLLCATRLVQQHAADGRTEALLAMLEEAEAFLVEGDAERAGNFFTEIAHLAQTPALEPIADELRDRALMGIARKMTQSLSTSSRSLATLLKNPTVWPVPLTGDAQHALTVASRQPRLAPQPSTFVTVRTRNSNVTACCQMAITGAVFLGFETGEVVCYEPATGAVHTMTRESGPILSLAVDASKTFLLILSEISTVKVCLRILSRAVGYRMIDYCLLDVNAPAQLAIQAVNSQVDFAIVWFGSEYRTFALPKLVAISSESFTDTGEIPDVVVVCGSAEGRTPEKSWLLALYGQVIVCMRMPPGIGHDFALNWIADKAHASTLRQFPLTVAEGDGFLISGLDTNGNLFRSLLRVEGGPAHTECFHPVGPDRYLAFAFVRANLLAGIHVKGVDWWTPGGKRPTQTKLTLTNPVAAFPLPGSGDLLIVEADGLLTRVPIQVGG